MWGSRGSRGYSWWSGLSTMLSKSWASRDYSRPAAYPTDEDWFEKAWRPYIEYVMRGLSNHGARLIGNCAGEYGTTDPHLQFQRSHLDGVIYEQWAVGWPRPASEGSTGGGGWLPGATIERRINALLADPLAAWGTD